MEKNKIFTVSVFAEVDFNHLNAVPPTRGFMLSVPRIYKKEAFFSKNEIPNENGTQLITQMLSEALMANIHTAHQNGILDSAEHFREVIATLETLFVSQCTVDVGFEDKLGMSNVLKGK